jgi:hypothetical protein
MPTKPTQWTEEAIRALGVFTNLRIAGEIFGLSRPFAYRLAHDGLFPVPVYRVGTTFRVPVAAILAAAALPASTTEEPDEPQADA